MEGRLAPGTAHSYANDVARFLRKLGSVRVSELNSDRIVRVLSSVPRSVEDRMKSALGDFFAHAFAERVLLRDPLRMLKYQRKTAVHERQTDFFGLLEREGVSVSKIRQLVWADFLLPCAMRRKRGLKVGRNIKVINSGLWVRLEREFRSLAVTQGLNELVRRRIA